MVYNHWIQATNDFDKKLCTVSHYTDNMDIFIIKQHRYIHCD